MSTESLVIGSFMVIGLCIAVVIFATRAYRQSSMLFSQAMSQPLSEPMELICGVRMGWLNATSPFGGVRISNEGVMFTAFGVSARVPWSGVSWIDLVKPFNGIGWGVRIRSAGRPDHIVWVLKRALADRVLEACELHGVRIERQPRLVF
jgi:hypothetical protein